MEILAMLGCLGIWFIGYTVGRVVSDEFDDSVDSGVATLLLVCAALICDLARLAPAAMVAYLVLR